MKAIRNVGAKIFGPALFIACLLALSTPARASVNVNPTTINFGAANAGAVSTAFVTLTNNGSRNVGFAGISVSSAQFSYVGPTGAFTLKPSQTLKVGVSFLPVAAQSYSGSLIFTRANGSTITVSLAGAGTGSQNTGAGSFTIWPNAATPKVIDQGPDSPVELGVTFRSDTSGYITGVRFYKSTANIGTHVGNLWSSSGTRLASATFTSETASGWQQVNFPAPVLITANTNYVASYHTNAGHYSEDDNFFASSAVDQAPLHALVNSSPIPDGRYAYGSGSSFPKVTYNSANYWVDVVFSSAVNTTPAPPVITSQPVGRTITAGQTASFSVTVSGTSPFTYQWKKNGTAMSGATSASYTTPPTTTSDSGALFTVTVTNSVGNVTSSAATLTVNVASIAPSITTQPSSSTVMVGQTASFAVSCSGTSPFTYQWKRNGAAISGATSASYTTPATATSDSGSQFTVTVTNSTGTVTSGAATLTVNTAAVAPSITTQPASRTVTAGQTASFSVGVSGTSPFTYQWSKNGATISGATSSSYTTPATTTSDNSSQFTVIITNSVGNVTSSAATLTVNAGTLLLTVNPASLSFGNVNISASSTKSATVTNSGTANVTISGISYSGAGFTTSGLSSGLILAPGQTATLNVTFAPAAAGNIAGSVAVASNATNSPGTVSLSASGVPVVSHSAVLSWIPSTSSVIGYQVYSATVSGGPYTKLTASVVSLSSYSDSTVLSGNTYYYVVTAVNSSSIESAYSNQASAVIP